MRRAHILWTRGDLEAENSRLKKQIAELAQLVLDAEERSLSGRISPFEGRSIIVHERTWARVRRAAEQCLGRLCSQTSISSDRSQPRS